MYGTLKSIPYAGGYPAGERPYGEYGAPAAGGRCCETGALPYCVQLPKHQHNTLVNNQLSEILTILREHTGVRAEGPPTESMIIDYHCISIDISTF